MGKFGRPWFRSVVPKLEFNASLLQIGLQSYISAISPLWYKEEYIDIKMNLPCCIPLPLNSSELGPLFQESLLWSLHYSLQLCVFLHTCIHIFCL